MEYNNDDDDTGEEEKFPEENNLGLPSDFLGTFATRRQKDEKGKPRIVDKRRISFDDAMKGKLIPMFGGRPEREKAIGKEDVIDLTIALEASKDWEEFIQRV